MRDNRFLVEALERWPLPRRLEPLAAEIDFQRNWQAVKADNKRVLARLIKEGEPTLLQICTRCSISR
jgi:hypothetical protein